MAEKCQSCRGTRGDYVWGYILRKRELCKAERCSAEQSCWQILSKSVATPSQNHQKPCLKGVGASSRADTLFLLISLSVTRFSNLKHVPSSARGPATRQRHTPHLTSASHSAYCGQLLSWAYCDFYPRRNLSEIRSYHSLSSVQVVVLKSLDRSGTNDSRRQEGCHPGHGVF
jgi:hypothetical protein